LALTGSGQSGVLNSSADERAVHQAQPVAGRDVGNDVEAVALFLRARFSPSISQPSSFMPR
jgi:hypothetical protein